MEHINETKPKEYFINIDCLNLPCHKSELYDINEMIRSLQIDIRETPISNITHNDLFDRTCKLLTQVGELSKCVFNIMDTLDVMYFTKYKNSPELSKKLWLEHYDELHRPYTKLKNRCFRILDELDEKYFEKYSMYPPNWNI